MSHDLASRSILFLVTEDWYFVSHRLPVARAARDAGMRVHVATRIGAHGDVIRNEGFELHPLPWKRRGNGVLSSLAAILAIRRLIADLRPAIVHAVALKAVVFCGIATLASKPGRLIFAITGLGYSFTGRTVKSAVVRTALRLAFRLAVDRSSAVVLLQNDDDGDVLREGGFLRHARTLTIRGSGIDTDWYAPQPEPDGGPLVVAVVSRMIAIKGIATLVAASRLLIEEGVDHRLVLVGAPDPDNPTSISRAQLEEWGARPWIEWAGPSTDVRDVWARAHIAALTSQGGEGLPKSLLEAAACQRPLLATDVPGSREIAIDGITALTAPPGDAPAIAGALRRLLEDKDLRLRLGREARSLAVARFAEERIVEQTLELYSEATEGHENRTRVVD